MDETVVDLPSLPRIFDRQRRDHPWSAAFEELESAPEPTRRHVIENWRMDHRMPRDRETDLLSFPGWGAPSSGAHWFSNLRDYFVGRLCQPVSSALGGYLPATLEPQNTTNGIAPRTVPPHEQLLHAACLNSLLHFLQTGAAPAAAGRLKLKFSYLTGQPFPDPPVADPTSWARFEDQVDEIAKALNDRGAEAVQTFARALSDALQPNEPLWWATFAQEIQPLLEAGDGHGLCQALGLGHLHSGQWLVLWRYEVRDLLERAPPGAAVLFRPTAAEAVDSPFHFPSPPGHRYGITMPLASSSSAFREVLNRPLVGDLAAGRCTGTLIPIKRPPIEDHGRISSLRRRHRRRLERQFPTGDTRAWLGRHPAEK